MTRTNGEATKTVAQEIAELRGLPVSELVVRYKVAFDFLNEKEWKLLRDMTLTINTIFGWDFNSCECLRQDGEFYPCGVAGYDCQDPSAAP